MTLRYFRFRIGDSVFVPASTGTHYLSQMIRGQATVRGQNYWETGLGWFPDRFILSADEYREWLRLGGVG
jgi:hypothetical protein